MKRVKVSLDNMKKITEFNKTVNKLSFDLIVCKNKWRVDAKSLMGLFSLDLSEPIQLYYNSEYDEEVNKVLKEWIIPINDNDPLYIVGRI